MTGPRTTHALASSGEKHMTPLLLLQLHITHLPDLGIRDMKLSRPLGGVISHRSRQVSTTRHLVLGRYLGRSGGFGEGGITKLPWQTHGTLE